MSPCRRMCARHTELQKRLRSGQMKIVTITAFRSPGPRPSCSATQTHPCQQGSGSWIVGSDRNPYEHLGESGLVLSDCV